jgi:hypothetical protein
MSAIIDFNEQLAHAKRAALQILMDLARDLETNDPDSLDVTREKRLIATAILRTQPLRAPGASEDHSVPPSPTPTREAPEQPAQHEHQARTEPEHRGSPQPQPAFARHSSFSRQLCVPPFMRPQPADRSSLARRARNRAPPAAFTRGAFLADTVPSAPGSDPSQLEELLV